MRKLIDKLYKDSNLRESELLDLITNITREDREYLFECARNKAREHYSYNVYLRGLIEVSSYCKNDCYYCGLRASNKCAERYRLDKSQILECCKTGYELGLRTFVLQGGEDMHYTDEILVDIISAIRKSYPDCAITLSLGEKSVTSYQKYFDAGANRYLLRHEAYSSDLYSKLHPKNLNIETRLECLKNLKQIGFQTGCGFMVGAPYQTYEHIVKDLRFIKDFQPEMVGIGPFLPHSDTPFGEEQAGSVSLTLTLLAVVRLLVPTVLLPATTALSTASEDGLVLGVRAGANVVMPNLSPLDVRKKYMLYDGKKSSGTESAQAIDTLKEKLETIGYEVNFSRGDNIKFAN